MLMRMSCHSALVSPVQCAAYEPDPRNVDLRVATEGGTGVGWGRGSGVARAQVWVGLGAGLGQGEGRVVWRAGAGPGRGWRWAGSAFLCGRGPAARSWQPDRMRLAAGQLSTGEHPGLAMGYATTGCWYQWAGNLFQNRTSVPALSTLRASPY